MISTSKISDAQSIRRLEREVWGEEVVSKYDAPMFVRFGWCYVAKEGSRIVGSISSYPTKNNEVYVADWVVDRAYRSKNIGINLYKRLIKKVGGRDIVSFINPKNVASLEAHKKLGFKVVKKLKDPYGLKRGIEGGYRIFVRLQNKKA